MQVDVDSSWGELVKTQLQQPYMQQLQAFLQQQKALNKAIFPREEYWFHALKVTPLAKVRVVILGQDPYHQPNQAHGLCFSVLPEVKVPPSLRNIYKELQTDLAIPPVGHGYLEAWAKQGVLLLNTVLSVEESKAGSHQGQGWEHFSDAVIAHINQQCNSVVFMLWGSDAQKKGARIDTDRHLVLKAPHPSPLSAYRGFFGCRHFSQANTYLSKRGRRAIQWQLPERPVL